MEEAAHALTRQFGHERHHLGIALQCADALHNRAYRLHAALVAGGAVHYHIIEVADFLCHGAGGVLSLGNIGDKCTQLFAVVFTEFVEGAEA